MPNRGLFGLPVCHVVRSESVWNSLGICGSTSSSSGGSSICSSSSCSSGSSSSSLAIWRRPAVASNVSTTAARRAGLIQSGPRPIRQAGGD